MKQMKAEADGSGGSVGGALDKEDVLDILTAEGVSSAAVEEEDAKPQAEGKGKKKGGRQASVGKTGFGKKKA